VGLSVVIALLTVWAAIALAYLYNWPIGFVVGTLSALAYGAGRAYAAWHRNQARPALPQLEAIRLN
jgi:zinc/manganese transport system permease protein